ncbi:MAG: preprotein translocase subunit SecG [Pseudomonadota bacterium]
MAQILLVVHLLIVIALIALVLLQRSEGGGLGIGGGGGGAGGGLVSSRGAADALARNTTWLAAAFFTTSLVLFVLSLVGGDGGVDLQPGQTPATSPIDSNEGLAPLPGLPPLDDGQSLPSVIPGFEGTPLGDEGSTTPAPEDAPVPDPAEGQPNRPSIPLSE